MSEQVPCQKSAWSRPDGMEVEVNMVESDPSLWAAARQAVWGENCHNSLQVHGLLNGFLNACV